MKNLILTLIITLPLTLLGQGWEQNYGDLNTDEYGYSVQQTSDGGYIIAGASNNDPFLLKTDGNGNELWSQVFGGDNKTDATSVQQTTDGGYIITGRTYGPSEIYLLKTDGNGNEQWSQTFGGIIGVNFGYSTKQTNDGGYIITGQNQEDVILIKTDGNGNELWTKFFGGTDLDRGYSVQQTNDGGYIITGFISDTTIFFPTADVYLIKTDVNGIELWSQTFGGTSSDWGYSVQQTNDGGYIITGNTNSFGNGSSDVYLIKTDGNGNEQWSQTFGGTDGDEGYSVQQTNDGGYIITGWTASFGSPYGQIYLIKTDGNGNEQWSQTFGGTIWNSSVSSGNSVQQTTDGGYIITGMINNEFDIMDIILIKTDSNGNITSTFEIPLPNSNRKLEKTLDILGKETKPQPNTPIIEIYDDGTVEKKLIVD